MDYEVIVVGAGPAGGQCARDLAKQGRKVLLIDKAKSFLENNYSSGGAPLDIMEAFDLPSSTVGTYWNHLRVISTNEQTTWNSLSPFGPVLDFDRLRAFLAEETEKYGGAYRLGWQYQTHQKISRGLVVQIKNLVNQELLTLRTKVLIDATGTDRKVLSKGVPQNHKVMAATGIEYHIRVSPAIYEPFAQSLNFFLGHKWMPQGYAWIFSMAPCQLKVGVIRYFQDQKHVDYQPSYKHYLNQLLTLCDPTQSYEILDKHGKTIHYTIGQKDRRYEGPILAIGDAISCLNPLGCEGIRHALVSGQEAAIEVDRFLKNEVLDFKEFHYQMNGYFGRRWRNCERMMQKLFKTKSDSLIDRTVKSFSAMNNQEIMDVIFQYRFSRTVKSYLRYFISGLTRWLKVKVN